MVLVIPNRQKTKSQNWRNGIQPWTAYLRCTARWHIMFIWVELFGAHLIIVLNAFCSQQGCQKKVATGLPLYCVVRRPFLVKVPPRGVCCLFSILNTSLEYCHSSDLRNPRSFRWCSWGCWDFFWFLVRPPCCQSWWRPEIKFGNYFWQVKYM